MAGSLDYEWSEMGVYVCVWGDGVGIGVSVPAEIFTSQGICSAHGTASCLFPPLSSFECHFLVQTTFLSSYRGWSLGGADDPRIGPDSPEPRAFSHFSNIYWVSPDTQTVS